MVVVPFVFFTALTLYLWNRHRNFDVCVYMTALYAFTAFFSIVLVWGEMLYGAGGIDFNNSNLKLSVTPTFLYCVFIALGILPFTMIYGRDMKKISARAPLLIDILSVVLIAEALLNLYLIYDSTSDILSGDLAAVRTDHYEGIISPAEVKSQSMPAIFRYFYYLNPSTILALPIWFYNISCRNVKWWYNGLLLITSLSIPLAAIQQADRSECLFYVLMFLFCYFFFRGMMSRKTKVRLYLVGGVLAVLLTTYFMAVSVARFEKRGGTAEGLIKYTGQNYLNFCYFWEYGKFNLISPEREFPLTWHFLFDIDSTPERRDVRSGQQGFSISVFPSYIGEIMIDISPLGMAIWMFYFFLLCCIIIRSPHREEMDISEVLAIFMAAEIPVLGIIYFRFSNHLRSYTLIITLLIYVFSRRKLVYK